MEVESEVESESGRAEGSVRDRWGPLNACENC